MKYILFISLLLLSNCQDNNSIEPEQRAIVENFIHSFNSYNIEGMTKDLAENFGYEHLRNGEAGLRAIGIESFKELLRSAEHTYKSRQETIESWELSKYHIEIESSFKGTLATDLSNGMKMGDVIAFDVRTIFEFADGKIECVTVKI